MNKRYLNFLLIAGAILMCSCGTYSVKMTKTLKKAFGIDFKGYYAFSYPTNNFGILTTYENDISTKNYLCAMLSCFDSLEPKNTSEWLRLKGYADIGEGSPVNIDVKTQSKISTKAILPKLLKTLNIKGGINKNNITTVTLKTGNGYVRNLNKIKFNDLINSLPEDNLYKKKYINGNLVIVVSDVIVNSMEVIVELKDSLKIELEAKFAPGASITQFSDIDLNGEIERIESGKYSIKMNQPIIILRLTKKQPHGGTLAVTEDFNNWIPVKDLKTLKRIK